MWVADGHLKLRWGRWLGMKVRVWCGGGIGPRPPGFVACVSIDGMRMKVV